MTNHETLQSLPVGDVKSLPPGLNSLNLDVQRLRDAVTDILVNGLTREQLIDIARTKITKNNPLLSHLVGDTGDDVYRNGLDARSFNRGAALALQLIDAAYEGGAPVLGAGSAQIAAEYRNRPESIDALKAAADGLLGSQEALSGAFDDALSGLPEGTDRPMARFGGGIVLLGEMAAAQFGGMGVEAWIE